MTADEIVERARAAVDLEQLAELARQWPRHGFAKYFDDTRWLRVNAQRALLLRLHDGPPRRVVDLGAGFGYFLLVARVLGHDVVGIDLPSPLYQAVTALMGVPVVTHRIEPRAPLPAELASERFDVVTAHMVCFNGHGTRALWGRRDWTTFLNPFIGATLHLELNRERDGALFPRGVAELFGERGAIITGRHVVFPRVRGPQPR